MALETAEQESRGLPPAPVSAGGAIASKSVGDIGRALYRYRGVALVVAGIFVASGVLPGPKSNTRPAAVDAAGQDVALSTPLDEEAQPAGEPVLSDAPVSFDDQPARFATMDPSVRFDETRSSTSDNATQPAAPRATSDEDRSTTTTTSAPTPLLIRAAAWSSRTAGTPVASDGVPAGSLPVGRRLGNDDKLSFIRLSGTAAVLKLRLASPEGQRNPAGAKVVACPVTSDWQPAQAMSFSADPDYDCAKSVAGKAEADGSWTFDLSGFADRTNDKGFALVPAGDGALADWQVAFASRA